MLFITASVLCLDLESKAYEPSLCGSTNSVTLSYYMCVTSTVFFYVTMTLARLLYGRVALIKQTLNSLLCAFKAKIDAAERVSKFAKRRPKFVAKDRCGLIFETC